MAIYNHSIFPKLVVSTHTLSDPALSYNHCTPPSGAKSTLLRSGAAAATAVAGWGHCPHTMPRRLHEAACTVPRHTPTCCSATASHRPAHSPSVSITEGNPL